MRIWSSRVAPLLTVFVILGLAADARAAEEGIAALAGVTVRFLDTGGSEVPFVPEAGHSIAWERPDAFNAKVLEFLKMSGSR